MNRRRQSPSHSLFVRAGCDLSSECVVVGCGRWRWQMAQLIGQPPPRERWPINLSQIHTSGIRSPQSPPQASIHRAIVHSWNMLRTASILPDYCTFSLEARPIYPFILTSIVLCPPLHFRRHVQPTPLTAVSNSTNPRVLSGLNVPSSSLVLVKRSQCRVYPRGYRLVAMAPGPFTDGEDVKRP
ncbi:hypothetical protein BD311DRAFT_370881 [Dichomitus squalens]|uniref:Uncharacterized protein n=1 Tax=Dichomitus squalens TaxID=114155 RepID=A0A4Q9ML46_9APHY|nr:hypothetical protein BD311DRAFT_370881 [Dichomitus squalens]